MPSIKKSNTNSWFTSVVSIHRKVTLAGHFSFLIYSSESGTRRALEEVKSNFSFRWIGSCAVEEVTFLLRI